MFGNDYRDERIKQLETLVDKLSDRLASVEGKVAPLTVGDGKLHWTMSRVELRRAIELLLEHSGLELKHEEKSERTYLAKRPKAKA